MPSGVLCTLVMPADETWYYSVCQSRHVQTICCRRYVPQGSVSGRSWLQTLDFPDTISLSPRGGYRQTTVTKTEQLIESSRVPYIAL